MTDSKITIILADDHPMLIDGVASSLEEDKQLKVLGKTQSPSEIIDMYNELKPDVVITDIMFGPGKPNGLEILSLLVRNDKDVKVILFSQYDHEEYIEKAYSLGAMAYLPKTSDPSILVEAVKSAFAGEMFLLPETSAALAKYSIKKNKQKNLKDILNEQEFELFIVLASGKAKSLKDAATELGISQRTINNLMKNIKNKTGLDGQVDFALRAFRDKLID